MPRYRRWGAWLIALMLVAFMGYIGLRYQALVGRDCSCFPWLKRAVTPALFRGRRSHAGGRAGRRLVLA